MMDMRAFSLDDKYRLSAGKIYLTGIQALTRLCLLQKQRDLEAGLNTAGFVSGYRGSPLGGLDQALWSIADRLKQNDITFQPGLNEDLAATAVWGSQQLNLFPGAEYDGVFGLWYGKGPGVDRSGDVFKHANAAGTSAHGGVLLCMGDDHTAKSSTLPHQSEFALMDAGIPILNPASIQEILDYGLYGWAMSRYSGCWVGLKTISETMDSSSSVSADNKRVQIIKPHDFNLPKDGVHIRINDTPLEQEARLHQYKLFAAIAFAQANGLNRMVIDTPNPRLGIITTGKSYLDVRQALSDLGIDSKLAYDIGIRLYKIGMPWPLDKQGVREFAQGLDEILVVEEKRALIENQVKEQLYNWADESRPRVVGKCDEQGEWLLPSMDELTPARIARVIAERIGRYVTSETIRDRLAFLIQKEKSLQSGSLGLTRVPHFCSGCPHNTSTRVPEASRATAGIGCHYMVKWMDRNTDTFTQMGGEGVPWIGQAPFCKTGHIYANLGDGTYFHSGSLAIRAAIAAGVNITYKLLYNNAVAMTGGQAIDGELSIPNLTQQLAAEGVKHIAIVSDDTRRLNKSMATDPDLAAEVKLYPRAEFDHVQTTLREVKGVSVLIYDQMCATEKRRQIKRGKLAETKTFAYINADVCEDCGDCSRKSNCLAVVPRDTPMGRKRRIDQAACNHDYSCIEGFCPSFVSIKGERKSANKKLVPANTSALKEPELPKLDRPYAMVITGVGGTGIVTLSAILGVAAHIDGKGINVLDMTGLAQKFGAVSSHVQIAAHSEDLYAARIAAGQADLLLGCDAITSSSEDTLAKLDPQRSRAVLNDHATVTSDYIRNPDTPFPAQEIQNLIRESVLPGQAWFFDSSRIAEHACGNPIASNMLMVGYAWQKGLIPLSRNAIERAIEINHVAIEMNLQAFNWGRCLADDTPKVIEQLNLAPAAELTLDEVIEFRVNVLIEYQNQQLAERYLTKIKKLRSRESGASDREELSQVAAQQYARLLMVKDEFEVARLLSGAPFKAELDAQFEPGYTVRFHLAPPLLSRPGENQGNPEKISFGAWLNPVLRLLSGQRRKRNTWLDPFRFSAERKTDLALIRAYEELMDFVIDRLQTNNREEMLKLLLMAEQVKGFGQLRLEKAEEVMAKWVAFRSMATRL
jgi:indolepyruvate ferredoxin oxidoreductase